MSKEIKAENDKDLSDKFENVSSFNAIPYYAWANRGKSQITVWIPRE